MRRTIPAIAAVAIVTACVLGVLADRSAAQERTVQIEGRVLWVAAETMVVAPSTGGSPVNVDLSRVSQDQYMTLTDGDVVAVTGTLAPQGDRVVATSIANP